MKTRIYLALLLAAILPVALTAQEASHHNTPSHGPLSVPDTASTLLLLGAGLCGLIGMKQRFFFRTQ